MDLRSSECDVVSLYVVCFSVNVSVCFVCCVFDSVCVLLVKQFVICLGIVAILLLNVMDMFSVCGGVLLYRPCMVFQSMCVLCQHLLNITSLDCGFNMAAVKGSHSNYPISRHIMTHIKQTQ